MESSMEASPTAACVLCCWLLLTRLVPRLCHSHHSESGTHLMVRIWVTQEELGVEPTLLHIERSQPRWLRHLIKMPPGLLEVLQACFTRSRPQGRPRK